MGSSASIKARSCEMWLRKRTVSSSTAILSAKMAASVNRRCSSTWVLPSNSSIRFLSFSLYSRTVCGERSSTNETQSRMVSARERISARSFSPSVSRIVRKRSTAREATLCTAVQIRSSSAGAFCKVKTSGKRDKSDTEISSFS